MKHAGQIRLPHHRSQCGEGGMDCQCDWTSLSRRSVILSYVHYSVSQNSLTWHLSCVLLREWLLFIT